MDSTARNTRNLKRRRRSSVKLAILLLAGTLQESHGYVFPHIRHPCRNARTRLSSTAVSGIIKPRETRMTVEPSLRELQLQYREDIISATKNGDWEGALLALKTMVREGIPRDTSCYACVIRACSAANKIGEASQTFADMREDGIPKDTLAYNAAIIGCIGEHSWPWAVQLLEEMKMKGVIQDVGTYTSVIKAVTQGKQGDVAMALLSQMQSQGLTPTAEIYKLAMRGCAASGQGKSALIALHQLEECSRLSNISNSKGSDGGSGVADLQSYLLAMQACVSGRMSKEALTIFKRMKRLGVKVDETAYRLAMRAMEEMDWRETLDLKQEIRLNGFRIETDTYNSVLRSCNYGAQYEETLRQFSQMKRDRAKPDEKTYTSVIKACANFQKPRWEEALTHLNKQQATGEVNSYCINWAITACARAGRWAEVDVLIKQLEKDLDGPDAVTYAALLGACQHIGDGTRALEVLDEMKTKGFPISDNLYGRGIAALQRAGKTKEGSTLFAEMISRGIRPSPTTLHYALRCADEMGDIEAIKAIITRMGQMGFEQQITREKQFATQMGNSKLVALLS